MDQIAKDKVQAGIPPSIKLFRRYLSHHNGVSYLSFYCRYCSAKIASKIMQEDGRVVITSIKYNHLHTTAKFESQIEEEIYRVYQMEKEILRKGTSRKLS